MHQWNRRKINDSAKSKKYELISEAEKKWMNQRNRRSMNHQNRRRTNQPEKWMNYEYISEIKVVWMNQRNRRRELRKIEQIQMNQQ